MTTNARRLGRCPGRPRAAVPSRAPRWRARRGPPPRGRRRTRAAAARSAKTSGASGCCPARWRAHARRCSPVRGSRPRSTAAASVRSCPRRECTRRRQRARVPLTGLVGVAVVASQHQALGHRLHDSARIRLDAGRNATRLRRRCRAASAAARRHPRIRSADEIRSRRPAPTTSRRRACHPGSTIGSHSSSYGLPLNSREVSAPGERPAGGAVQPIVNRRVFFGRGTARTSKARVWKGSVGQRQDRVGSRNGHGDRL